MKCTVFVWMGIMAHVGTVQCKNATLSQRIFNEHKSMRFIAQDGVCAQNEQSLAEEFSLGSDLLNKPASSSFSETPAQSNSAYDNLRMRIEKLLLVCVVHYHGVEAWIRNKVKQLMARF